MNITETILFFLDAVLLAAAAFLWVDNPNNKNTRFTFAFVLFLQIIAIHVDRFINH